jgi:hypothetical protein
LNILCTFPGRNGDLLWALPTIRAISQRFGVPVDLQIGGEFTGIVDLLCRQPYLNGVWADERWSLTPPEEWKAPATPPYDHVFHCGYRGWPEVDLPTMTLRGVVSDYQLDLQVDFETPWITVPPATDVYPILGFNLVSGWSDEWFELKYGIVRLLPPQYAISHGIVVPPSSRWDKEAVGLAVLPYGWTRAAQTIQHAKVFLGCCSALHVLACAMGKKVVVMEPSVARHNPIFYPFGMDGRIRVVKGNDGKPTHDVRHTIETLNQVLHER